MHTQKTTPKASVQTANALLGLRQQIRALKDQEAPLVAAFLAALPDDGTPAFGLQKRLSTFKDRSKLSAASLMAEVALKAQINALYEAEGAYKTGEAVLRA